MRDVHDFKTNYKVTTEWSSGGWKPWSSYSAYLQTTRTYRSDATSTQPINGLYIRPTAYDAFYFYANSSPFSYEWDNLSVNPPRHHRTYGDAGSTKWPFPQNIFTWGCNQSYPFRPKISASVIGQAESHVYDKIYANDFNLGQSLGEMKETVSFIADAVFRFLLFYRLLRTGNAKMAYDLLRSGLSRASVDDIASGYVAYQYGIKPLMSDIYNAAQFIRNGIIPNTNAKVVVRKKDPLGNPTSYSNVELDFDGSYQRGIEIQVVYRVKNETLYNLDRYGLTDPLALAWELVPLSFVVDWFTGVGGFLNSLNAPMGLQFLSAYRTSYVTGRGTYEYNSTGQSNIAGTRPKVNFSTHSSYRYKYLSWPIPNAYCDFGINLNQALSVVALAKLRA